MQQVWHRKLKRAPGLPPQTQAARGTSPAVSRVPTGWLRASSSTYSCCTHMHTELPAALSSEASTLSTAHRKGPDSSTSSLKQQETPEDNRHKTEFCGKWAWGQSEPVCPLCRHTHLCNESSIETRTFLKELAPTTVPFPGFSVDLPHRHISSGFQAINTKAPPQGQASMRCLPSAFHTPATPQCILQPRGPCTSRRTHSTSPGGDVLSINPTTTPHTPLGHFYAHTWYF